MEGPKLGLSMNASYDFYMVTLKLNDSNSILAYLSDAQKKISLCAIPVAYETAITQFCTRVNIVLNVTGDTNKIAYIRDDLNMANHGFVDREWSEKESSVADGNQWRDLSDQSNLRARNIVTIDEAI